MPKNSVVIVPGIGGSVLRSADHPGVSNTWLSPSLILRGTKRWLSVNGTRYDMVSRSYVSIANVSEVGFGGTEGVRDVMKCRFIPDVGQSYFGHMIDQLVSESVVRSAPYDFRTILNKSGGDYIRRLGNLLVETGPSVIVAHSAGAILARAAMANEDVNRNVVGMVEICPAHGGCVASLSSMASGAFYKPVKASEREELAAAARSMAGLVLTLPNKAGFAEGEVVMVDHHGRDHFAGGPWHWEEVRDAWAHLALPILSSVTDLPPHVKHTIVYNDAIPTPASVDMRTGMTVDAKGDGVLTAASMLSRASDRTETVKIHSEHRVAPRDCGAIEAVVKLLS